MEKPDFLAWALGFPLVYAVVESLGDSHREMVEVSPIACSLSLIVSMTVYFSIGVMLWEGGE